MVRLAALMCGPIQGTPYCLGPAMAQAMGRLIEKANARTVVVFVHGLGDDFEAAWGNFPSLLESTKKSGVECHRRGKSATVPFNRLILRGILRAVRPRAADTGPPTFWRSPTDAGAAAA